MEYVLSLQTTSLSQVLRRGLQPGIRFQIQRHKNNPGFLELPSNVIMHLYNIQINLYFKENREDNTSKLVRFVSL